MSAPGLVPLLALALLALGLLTLEVRRGDRRALPLRMAALLLVLGGAFLLLRTPHVAAPSGTLMLRTPGAATDAPGFRLDDTGPPSTGTLSTLGALGDTLRQASSIRIAGWGLLPAEWAALPAVPVSFTPAPLPPGIVALEAPQGVTLGAQVQVRGRVSLPTGDSGWVRLLRDTTLLDSAPVGRGGTFELTDRPRAAGRVGYTLELRGRSFARSEPLGVHVLPAPVPRVLVLEGSPSFETGFLKRWLGGQGGRVSVRTAVSRARFRTEHLNGTGPALEPLTRTAASQFDVIVADGPALAAAGEQERAALARAVSEDGVGLVVVPGVGGAAAAIARFLPGFRLAPQGDEPLRVARPRWAGQGRRPSVGVSVEAGRPAAPGTQPLIAEEDGTPLALRRTRGRGVVALTLVATPSRWFLDGDRELFAGYWSTLLGAVARDTSARVSLASDGPLRPGRRATLTVLNPAPLARLAVRASGGQVDTIPLEQDPEDPRLWRGFHWPADTGWHTVTLDGEVRFGFPVHGPGSWMALEAALRLETSRAGLQGGQAASSSGPARDAEPLGFLLFVAGASLLWWEHRRRRFA